MTSVWSGHEASPWPASLELEAPGPTFDQESPFLAAGTTAGTTASEYLAPAGNLPPAGNGLPAAHLVLAHESVEEAAVRRSIASGTRDPDVLTEVAIGAHYARPDTPAALLDPTSPPALAQREAVREQIVVPLLRSGGAVAPAGELWLPGAERVQNAKAAGGQYVDSPWRFVFHTVEAEPSAHGFRALAARHANPPHLWAMPRADLVIQTVPLNRSAYALARPGTIQTNRLHAVQVEVWGFAAKMGDVDPDFLRWLADRVLVPVARLVPINLERVEPTRGRSAYGRNGAGRLTPAEWNAFNGVCGHQHVPDNDHWDPGKLDLAAIATRARRTLGPTGGVRREDEAFADDAAFAEGATSGHDGASFVAEQDGAGEGERAGNDAQWITLSSWESPGAAIDRYTTEPGVVLTAVVASAVRALAEKYFAATSKNIRVTSGTRTVMQQADAMYNKLLAGDSLADYTNQVAAAEIKKAYTDGVALGKTAASIKSDMAKVIDTQIASRVYISKHLLAGAVDIRILDMTPAEKTAFKQAAKDEGSFQYPPLEETRPPHWHLQLK